VRIRYWGLPSRAVAGGAGGAPEITEEDSGEGEEGGIDGDFPFEIGGLLVRAIPSAISA